LTVGLGKNAVQRTAILSGCAALIAFLSLTPFGHLLWALAVAIGLAIGASNAWLIDRALTARSGFGAGGLGRMLVLTVAGLGAAALLGLDKAAFVIGGIALAQVIMAAAAFSLTLREAQR